MTSTEVKDHPAKPANALALLDARDLHVSYGGVSALSGVSLSMPEGEIVAVLGSNGAGKTTLLRALSGTLAMQGGTIDSGTVELKGRSLTGLDPAEIVRAGVVQVPEGRRIFGELTVEENLRAGAFGRGRREAAPRRSRASTNCSRCCRSAGRSRAACFRAASSRCSPSGGR